jgi:hypothetical protein
MATRQLPRGHDTGKLNGARYEVKATAARHQLPQLRAWLRAHPMMFAQSYLPRQVNNAYFDTPDLDNYIDNLAGNAARQKARLRWYGQDVKQVLGALEFKHKLGRQGWKVTHTLAQPLDFTAMPWTEIVAAIRREIDGGLRAMLDTCGRPVLINRFQREYYTSMEGGVRATLDYDQTGYDQRHAALPNLRFALPLPDQVVVEFKAGNGNLPALARTLETFPLRVSRNSKYATAVEAMLGQL